MSHDPHVCTQVALLRGRRALTGKLVMLMQALTSPTMAGSAAVDQSQLSQVPCSSQLPITGPGNNVPGTIQVSSAGHGHAALVLGNAPLPCSDMQSGMTFPVDATFPYAVLDDLAFGKWVLAV